LIRKRVGKLFESIEKSNTKK